MTANTPTPPAFPDWVPNKDYGNTATWPPVGHPLYGLFHEAHITGSYDSAIRTRYERIVDWLATLTASPASAPKHDGPPAAGDVRDEDGFICEYDEGEFTISWPNGEWLIARRDGSVVRGRSPYDPAHPIKALAPTPSQPASPASDWRPISEAEEGVEYIIYTPAIPGTVTREHDKYEIGCARYRGSHHGYGTHIKDLPPPPRTAP